MFVLLHMQIKFRKLNHLLLITTESATYLLLTTYLSCLSYCHNLKYAFDAQVEVGDVSR